MSVSSPEAGRTRVGLPDSRQPRLRWRQRPRRAGRWLRRDQQQSV